MRMISILICALLLITSDFVLIRAAEKKYLEHTIKEKETFWDISTIYYGSPDHWELIKNANDPNYNPKKLSIGLKLIIPPLENNLSNTEVDIVEKERFPGSKNKVSSIDMNNLLIAERNALERERLARIAERNAWQTEDQARQAYLAAAQANEEARIREAAAKEIELSFTDKLNTKIDKEKNENKVEVSDEKECELNSFNIIKKSKVDIEFQSDSMFFAIRTYEPSKHTIVLEAIGDVLDNKEIRLNSSNKVDVFKKLYSLEVFKFLEDIEKVKKLKSYGIFFNEMKKGSISRNDKTWNDLFINLKKVGAASLNFYKGKKPIASIVVVAQKEEAWVELIYKLMDSIDSDFVTLGDLLLPDYFDDKKMCLKDELKSDENKFEIILINKSEIISTLKENHKREGEIINKLRKSYGTSLFFESMNKNVKVHWNDKQEENLDLQIINGKYVPKEEVKNVIIEPWYKIPPYSGSDYGLGFGSFFSSIDVINEYSNTKAKVTSKRGYVFNANYKFNFENWFIKNQYTLKILDYNASKTIPFKLKSNLLHSFSLGMGVSFPPRHEFNLKIKYAQSHFVKVISNQTKLGINPVYIPELASSYEYKIPFKSGYFTGFQGMANLKLETSGDSIDVESGYGLEGSLFLGVNFSNDKSLKINLFYNYEKQKASVFEHTSQTMGIGLIWN